MTIVKQHIRTNRKGRTSEVRAHERINSGQTSKGLKKIFGNEQKFRLFGGFKCKSCWWDRDKKLGMYAEQASRKQKAEWSSNLKKKLEPKSMEEAVWRRAKNI